MSKTGMACEIMLLNEQVKKLRADNKILSDEFGNMSKLFMEAREMCARKDAALRTIVSWRDDPSAPYRNLTDAAELARSALTATATETETGETK